METSIIAELERDIEAKHLSRHPFYQQWNEGAVSLEALREYAKEYYRFVELFPRLVSRVHSNAEELEDRLAILENLNEEENVELPHEELWIRFAEGLGVPREELRGSNLPETENMLAYFRTAVAGDFIGGCAALLAYEAQISEIAVLKKNGLVEHYGVADKRALEFFDEHAEVDIEHQKTWKRLIAKHAVSREQRRRARAALNDALDAMNGMLDGIHAAYCVN